MTFLPLESEERELLSLMAQRLPIEEIAARLDQEVNTVQDRVAAVVRKLGAPNREQAVITAIQSSRLRVPEALAEKVRSSQTAARAMDPGLRMLLRAHGAGATMKQLMRELDAGSASEAVVTGLWTGAQYGTLDERQLDDLRHVLLGHSIETCFERCERGSRDEVRRARQSIYETLGVDGSGSAAAAAILSGQLDEMTEYEQHIEQVQREGLSAQDLDLVRGLSLGRLREQVAEDCGLSLATVNRRLTDIHKRLNLGGVENYRLRDTVLVAVVLWAGEPEADEAPGPLLNDDQVLVLYHLALGYRAEDVAAMTDRPLGDIYNDMKKVLHPVFDSHGVLTTVGRAMATGAFPWPSSQEAFLQTLEDEPLTRRQLALLGHVVKGLTFHEIADLTDFKGRPVQSLVEAMRDHVGVTSTANLIAVAVWSGQLQLGEFDDFELPTDRPLVAEREPGPTPWDDLVSRGAPPAEAAAGEHPAPEPAEDQPSAPTPEAQPAAPEPEPPEPEPPAPEPAEPEPRAPEPAEAQPAAPEPEPPAPEPADAEQPAPEPPPAQAGGDVDPVIAEILAQYENFPRITKVGKGVSALPRTLERELIKKHAELVFDAVRDGQLPPPDALARFLDSLREMEPPLYAQRLLGGIADGLTVSALDRDSLSGKVIPKLHEFRDLLRVQTNAGAALIALWAGWID